jgi:CheY-like chemotaxis protein
MGEPGRLHRLAGVPFDTPMITCWVPTGDAVAQRLGVAHYLVKPVTREKLVNVLSRLGRGVDSVLVVDDEPETLQLFTRMLSSAPNGYRVLQAKTGQMALALLRERKPDVMLLDLIMPGMGGFQVLREKSEDPTIRDIPVVIVSSQDPTGEEIVSNTLTVSRAGGLSVRDLLRCVQALSEILMPSAQAGSREQPETPAG